VIGLGSGLLLPLALPDMDISYVRALGQIALALAAAAIAVRIGWAVVEPDGGRVRDARLLVLPIVFAALPLAAGLRIESWPMFLFLTLMELVVGFSEELVFRGFILRALLPGGMTRAVLVSSALFGLVHLGNIVYGASVAVTLFQVVGVFAFGVGMAAIVLRGGAFWPAILIHALSNAALRFSYITPQRLPTPLMSAIVMTLMLIYGAVLLWRAPRAASTRTATLERLG
jgi:membrane protease YdiL (CAAX protease family)